jgi:hypothetical protein
MNCYSGTAVSLPSLFDHHSVSLSVSYFQFYCSSGGRGLRGLDWDSVRAGLMRSVMGAF